MFLDTFSSYPENIMPDTEGVEPKTMIIGTNNVFEVGCGILYRYMEVCGDYYFVCKCELIG